jgi:hydroxypyruvate isomerase
MQRRSFLKTGLSAGAGVLLASRAGAAPARPPVSDGPPKHSASKWCYSDLSVEALAEAGKTMGLHGIDLLGPADWDTVNEHGLTCPMANAPAMDEYGIPKGWNRKAHHEALIPLYEDYLPRAAAADVPNVVCFSGRREGLSDERGLANCAAGLKQIMPVAEEHGVTVCMELLNSTVDHPDYQCDHTEWGVELVDRVGSPRFRLLYDIYHMQIMEGDIIRTIRNHHDAIAHYHTGGVPGRNEIDETQELHYPAIVRAIAETGYEGFIGQEFVPTADDPLASLREAIEICTV